MKSKRPYTHTLKNLFHEQADEIIPLLWPEYQVTQVLNLELPELETTYVEGSPGGLAEGIVGLAQPGAKIVGVYENKWIEHSGKFERVYRTSSNKSKAPIFLLIEVQAERDDEDLPKRFLTHFAVADLQIDELLEEEGISNEVNIGPEGTTHITPIYSFVLCPFPGSVPAPIREKNLVFNFRTLKLWEKDAREFLNAHASAVYYLLPVMKNTDATLLGLAIEELAQRFQGKKSELGRHLTGLNLLLHQSETMTAEEKQAAQRHLERFTPLIKRDPYDE